MIKILKIDTLDNKIIDEFQIGNDETYIIENDELYILSFDELKKVKDRSIELFEVANAPHHLDVYEKFVVKEC